MMGGVVLTGWLRVGRSLVVAGGGGMECFMGFELQEYGGGCWRIDEYFREEELGSWWSGRRGAGTGGFGGWFLDREERRPQKKERKERNETVRT
jgi:hypothetical protein